MFPIFYLGKEGGSGYKSQNTWWLNLQKSCKLPPRLEDKIAKWWQLIDTGDTGDVSSEVIMYTDMKILKCRFA